MKFKYSLEIISFMAFLSSVFVYIFTHYQPVVFYVSLIFAAAFLTCMLLSFKNLSGFTRLLWVFEKRNAKVVILVISVVAIMCSFFYIEEFELWEYMLLISLITNAVNYFIGSKADMR
jgi:hypothetical protein